MLNGSDHGFSLEEIILGIHFSFMILKGVFPLKIMIVMNLCRLLN